MGEQGVAERVASLIGLRVGPARAAQQRQPHDVAPDVVAVLAVVEEGDPVAGLAQVRPAVGAHLEAGHVPAGVGVGGPLEVAELDLVGGPVGVDGEREGHLEEAVALVPVHLGAELQAPGAGGQAHDLGDGGIPEAPHEAHARPQRSPLDHLDRVDLHQVCDLVEVVQVDVPGVGVVGKVGVELEHVAAAAGGQDLPARLLVPHRGEQTVVVPADAQELVLDLPLANRDGSHHGVPPHRGHVQRGVPAGGGGGRHQQRAVVRALASVDGTGMGVDPAKFAIDSYIGKPGFG